MRILFADKFPLSFIEKLEHNGHKCTSNPGLTAEALAGEVRDTEILVVRSTRVESDVIASGSELRMIIRAGAGTNTIDKASAAQSKIYVCNVPGKNAIAVAELVFGLLIAIDRNIPDNVQELRQGRWNKKRFAEAKGLFGRSIGVVGLGAIGMAVAERAAAFGMKLNIIHKPERPGEVTERLTQLGALEQPDLSTLAASCDIISFHTPASETTKELVDASLLQAMQPESILINTSRGDLIDEQALIEAMDEKGIRAGLDVYMNEPGSVQGEFISALAQHPNVFGTHHIGASTEQAQNAVAEGVVEIIEAFTQGHILHCVNMKV